MKLYVHFNPRIMIEKSEKQYYRASPELYFYGINIIVSLSVDIKF